MTPEGCDLHERALKLLQDADEIEQAAASARAEPAGNLKVTVPVPLAIHVIAPNLPLFRQRYPKLNVDLRVSDTFSDLIQEGIDVAIRIGAQEDSRFISRKLAPNRVCAFASPSYLKKRGVPQHIADIEGHDCVGVRLHSSGQFLRWPFRLGKRIVELLPTTGIVVDNTDAVAAAIAGGGGIGLSPSFVAASYVARGELTPILTEHWVNRHHITALWSESRRGNPNVKAFIAFLMDIFANPTPWDKLIDRYVEKTQNND